MEKTVLIILAHGFEELEAVGSIDLLRRARAVVTIATIENTLLVEGRDGICLKADAFFEDVLERDYDLIVLPGGPGHTRLRENAKVLDLLRKQAKDNRFLAAICAAPTILFEAGVLEGKTYTAHYTVLDELTDAVTDQCVVADGKLITSRGAGTAVEFGLALVETLFGAIRAEEIASRIHHRNKSPV